MARLPTIKVRDDNPRGWKIINASAFDPDAHEVFDAAPKAADLKPEPVAKRAYKRRGAA